MSKRNTITLHFPLKNLCKYVCPGCWLAIPAHFPDVKMYEYVVMPNHIHGIIEILGNGNSVWAKNISPLPIRAVPQHVSGFQSPSETIGSIVRGFKIGVVKWFITIYQEPGIAS
jgi:putative transposase